MSRVSGVPNLTWMQAETTAIATLFTNCDLRLAKAATKSLSDPTFGAGDYTAANFTGYAAFTSTTAEADNADGSTTISQVGIKTFNPTNTAGGAQGIIAALLTDAGGNVLAVFPLPSIPMNGPSNSISLQFSIASARPGQLSASLRYTNL